LKPQYDEPLSRFAYNFNWRRYSKAVGPMCETFDKAYQKIGLRK